MFSFLTITSHGNPTGRAIWVFVALAWVLLMLLLPLGRACVRIGLSFFNPFRTSTLVVGAGEVGKSIIGRLGRHKEYGLRVVGFLDTSSSAPDLEEGDPPGAGAVARASFRAALDRRALRYQPRHNRLFQDAASAYPGSDPPVSGDEGGCQHSAAPVRGPVLAGRDRGSGRAATHESAALFAARPHNEVRETADRSGGRNIGDAVAFTDIAAGGESRSSWIPPVRSFSSRNGWARTTGTS